MRVSVFVDGENLSATYSGAIWSKARSLGTVDFARIYGDVAQLGAWQTVPGARIMHSGSGKNSADILLTIEAMERALTDQCDAVVLASSDGDFGHLAVFLRERGLQVLGLGEAKAPQGYRAACTGFQCLTGANSGQELVPAKPPLSKLDRQILQVIHDEEGLENGLLLSRLGQRMREKHGVTTASLPSANWRSYLSKRPHVFSVQVDGTVARVRHCRLKSGLADRQA